MLLLLLLLFIVVLDEGGVDNKEVLKEFLLLQKELFIIFDNLIFLVATPRPQTMGQPLRVYLSFHVDPI